MAIIAFAPETGRAGEGSLAPSLGRSSVDVPRHSFASDAAVSPDGSVLLVAGAGAGLQGPGLRGRCNGTAQRTEGLVLLLLPEGRWPRLRLRGRGKPGRFDRLCRRPEPRIRSYDYVSIAYDASDGDVAGRSVTMGAISTTQVPSR